jgi:4-hydroxy-tetrahydrodipicolinate synthase
MTAAAAKQVYDACPPGYIVGMKEATGDVSRVADYRALLPPDFLLWSGDDATGAEFVLKGGDGVISVTSNVAPKLQSEIMKAANAGDADKVKELNKPLVRLHDDIFVQPNPIPAKYALERMGRAKAGIRTPLHPLDEDLRAVVDAALGEAGLI